MKCAAPRRGRDLLQHGRQHLRGIRFGQPIFKTKFHRIESFATPLLSRPCRTCHRLGVLRQKKCVFPLPIIEKGLQTTGRRTHFRQRDKRHRTMIGSAFGVQ